MSTRHHFDFDDAYQHQDPLDQWVWELCSQCDKPIMVSASRPPIFNADNCSCSEAASYSRGRAQLSPSNSLEARPEVFHHYDAAMATGHPIYPQSNASSSTSVPCPEGPEQQQPEITITNNYLPLVPAPGLNETQHRRSSSCHSTLSYQMRRFLIEQEVHFTQPNESCSETKFLKNDMPMHSSMEVHLGSGRSKPSHVSGVSSLGSGDATFGWAVDPVAGAGRQFDGSDHWGVGYPLVMSGLTEAMNECAIVG